MTEDESYAVLRPIFARVFGRDVALRPEMTARDVVGWDSLKHFDIIMDIEDALGIEVDGSKLQDLADVGDLARLIRTEAAGKPG